MGAGAAPSRVYSLQPAPTYIEFGLSSPLSGLSRALCQVESQRWKRCATQKPDEPRLPRTSLASYKPAPAGAVTNCSCGVQLTGSTRPTTNTHATTPTTHTEAVIANGAMNVPVC